MNVEEIEKRKNDFQDELLELKEKGLLRPETVSEVNEAYRQLYFSRFKEIERSFPPVSQPQAYQAPKKQVQPKRVRSSQEIRDRNITYILVIGVLMVLLSGIMIATSHWLNLNSMTKTLLIAGVAGLFMAISWVSGNILKIPKTSFAFWVLGSLFLPVTVLSAGYFELFGQWLSLFGEGKYLFGFIGTILCIPFYLYSVKKYKNRLFVWISFIFTSVSYVFLVASFYPTVDIFYLAIIFLNSLILGVYFRFKNRNRRQIFLQEMPLFTQANMILSTIAMLFFFDNPLFYGFNSLLVGILYLAMVFTHQRKEYGFVFSFFLVYGLYQLIENSALHSIDTLMFSVIGFIFIGMVHSFKEESLHPIFKYASGIISFFAFMYVSYQSVNLKPDSEIMLLSYLLIAINYLYLSYIHPRFIFKLLAPIFLVMFGFQGYRAYETVMPITGQSYMFIVGLLLLSGMFYLNKTKYLFPVKTTSYWVSLAVLIVSLFTSLIEDPHPIESSLFLFALGIVLYGSFKIRSNEMEHFIYQWLLPLSFLSSIVFGLFELDLRWTTIMFEDSLVWGISLIGLLLIGILWRIKEGDSLENPFFYVGFGLIPTAVFFYLIFLEESKFSQIPTLLWIYTVIFFIGLFRAKKEWLKQTFLYAGIFLIHLGTYYTLKYYSDFNIESMVMESLNLSIQVLILFGFYMILNTEWKKRLIFYLIPFTALVTINAIETIAFRIYPAFVPFSINMPVLFITMMIYLLERHKASVFTVIPLGLLIFFFLEIESNYFKNDIPILLVMMGVAFGLKILGEKFHPEGIYPFREMRFDMYSVFSFLLVWLVWDGFQYESWEGISHAWFELIPAAYVVYWIYSQVPRATSERLRNRILALTILTFLFPYYEIIDALDKVIPNKFELEFYLIPLILIARVIREKIYPHQKTMVYIELGVLSLVFGVLLFDASVISTSSNLLKSIVFGILALMALIYGFQFKIKSYFFVGAAALILNLFLQTEGFWTNLPWWAYLLISGLVLIIVASINEIQKDKPQKIIYKEKILKSFEDWD